MLACRVCLLESNEYNYSAGRECNFLHALHSASLPANLPSVRMCNTCGGKIRAKWERWAALLWASVCAESCSSTAASLSCLPDHWTWSRVHTWNRKCGGAYLHAGIQKKKNVKRRNKGTHTQRYIDFAVCPNSLLCTKKKQQLPTCLLTVHARIWKASELLSNAVCPSIHVSPYSFPHVQKAQPLWISSPILSQGYIRYLQPKQQTLPADLIRVCFCDSEEALE